MNHTIVTILSTTLVSTGVLVEFNLIRIFVNDWREDRRQQVRRRLREAAIGQSQIETRSSVRSRCGVTAAALVCGVMPCIVLAQSPATPSAASEPPSQAAFPSTGEQT
jgi:hypothetical protein